MTIKIKQISSDGQLQQAFAIRKKVFCVEQNVSEKIEMDRFDKFSNHILAFVDEKPIGTARWRFTVDGAKLERFAVLKEHRNTGVGKAMVEFVLNQVKELGEVYLNAQESVIPFYEKFGFKTVGERFFEADIPHKKMVI